MAERPRLMFNWTRKLKNDEFKSLSSALWDITKDTLKDSKEFDRYLYHTGNAHQELMSLSSQPKGHYNTKEINEWHKERKQKLTSITSLCLQNTKNKDFLKNHIDEIDHHVLLNKWFRRYGKRLYDFGIDRLTGVVRGLMEDYEHEPQFRAAIDSSFKKEFEEIVAINDNIVKAQTERTLDLSKPKLQRKYPAVRRGVTLEWGFLMSYIVLILYDDYPYSGDMSELTELFLTQQQILTDYRRIVKQRETKRANKKAKLQEHNQQNATSTND